jgi:hypothetical protein
MSLWRRNKPAAEPEPVFDGPMPSIFEKPKPPPLALFTLGGLIPPLWRVTSEGGSLGEAIRFLPDGRVLGAFDARDARWAQADGMLTVSDGERAVWVFDRREMVAGRETVLGTAEGEAIMLTPFLADLESVQLLADPNRPILVVFNSAASPIKTPETDWEFKEQVLSGHDLTLFAEHGDPSFWFINKTGRVLDRLRHLPACGYRRFLFLGLGSGGYAALMFAELFSHEFHDCAVRSVTINPHTALGLEHEEAIRAACEPALLPSFPSPDVLAQKDCPVSSIRELVRMSTRRREGDVQHRLLYDEGSPAGVYFAHPLDDLSGFTLQGVQLGQPEAEGAAAILRSGIFADALAWGLGA